MGMITIKKEVIKNWLVSKITPPKSIEEIAESINVSPSLLYKIIEGNRQVTPNVLRKLCDLTGYDVGDICTYDRNKEPEDDNDK
jgi:transcriptional regulator with XRE-family HTH domain